MSLTARIVTSAGILCATMLLTVVTAAELTTPLPQSEPLRVGGDVRAPQRTKVVNPVYPPELRQAGVQGIVIVEVVIGADGRVARAQVLRSQHSGFDEAALAAVRQWEDEPTRLQGTPVSIVMTVTVNFVLAGANLADAGRPGAGGPFSCTEVGAAPDLTGSWHGDDGLVYHVRTVCHELFWVVTGGEGAVTRLFHGTRQPSGEYAGRWLDMPPAESRGMGALRMRIVDQSTIEVVGDPAGVSIRRWQRKSVARVIPMRIVAPVIVQPPVRRLPSVEGE